MDIFEDARAILEQAGYLTYVPKNIDNIFYFEDRNLLGFVAVHEDGNEIINRWEELQDTFLINSASMIKMEPRKAWNIYSVHVTQKATSKESLLNLSAIEEDFRSTRKIVATGINSRKDIKRVLIPLLPVQNLISLQREDIIDRLRIRIAPDNGPLKELLGETSAKEIAREMAIRR